MLGSGILKRKEAATKEADKRKSCLIVSFGDYYSGKWCPGLTLFYRCVAFINVVNLSKNNYLARLNWNNGDWTWVKSQCPNCIKYFAKDTQLQAVAEVDSTITQLPSAMISNIGSAAEVNEPAVIFTSFGSCDDAEWTKNLDMGRELIKDLPETFPHAQDRLHQNLYEITYVVKRIEGFKFDDELFKYAATLAVASPKAQKPSEESPAKDSRSVGHGSPSFKKHRTY